MSSDAPAQGTPAPGRRRLRASSVLVGAALLVSLGGLAALGGVGASPLRVSAVADAGPAVERGDLLVSRLVPAEALRPGDLVTVADAAAPGLVTRHVRAVDWRGDVGRVSVGGAADAAGERWTLGRRDEVGRVALRVPVAGHVVSVLGTPAGRAGASAAVLVLALVAAALVRRPRREDVTALLVARLELLRLRDDADEQVPAPVAVPAPRLAAPDVPTGADAALVGAP